MAAVTQQATGLTDLVASTLRNLGRPNYTDLTTDLQEFSVMTNLALVNNRVKLKGGVGVQWNVAVNHAQSARNVGGIGGTDVVNIVDTMVQATADWRGTTANYAFFAEEMDMNSGEEEIVDLVAERRQMCMISLAEILEANLWGPPVALADVETPWGIKTWIVKNATEGFNGGAPSGYTSIGLNPTTYPRWKNYTFQYTNVSKDDMIRKWRTAARKTGFKPPVQGLPSPNTGDKYGYYTNLSALQALEEVLEAQNDNLGNAINPKDGEAVFSRQMVHWIPKLDADTTNPIYGVNWGWMKFYILNNWWLKETNVPVYPGQHTMSAHFLDCRYQVITKNRRTHFVGATATTEPA